MADLRGAGEAGMSDTRIFIDSAAPPISVTTTPASLPATSYPMDNPGGGSSAALGPYVGTYTLTSNTVLSLTAAAENMATNGFSHTVSPFLFQPRARQFRDDVDRHAPAPGGHGPALPRGGLMATHSPYLHGARREGGADRLGRLCGGRAGHPLAAPT
jgi:hypothetical protein